MIEKIAWKGKTIALILRGDYEPEGVSFITPQDNPFQLGILKHRQGTRIKPHVHKKSPRTINDIQEVLHMEYGKVEVEFYDAEGRKLKSAILNSNDTILLLSGGHGFNILEDAKIIEVKQGPYYGTEGDKERLDISQEG